MTPRGLRNNNPGNLNFARQKGATLETGVPAPRFAAFKTMQDGFSALFNQLRLYFSRGNNTLAGIIGLWAPPNENATQAYCGYVAKSMGVKPDTVLQPVPSTLAHIAQAICHYENGSVPLTFSQLLALAGVNKEA